MYTVFTDFHHASLLNSLIMLFEKRLGGNVFRPIGKDWYNQGFWKIYDHPATVEQYLGINGATPDGSEPLNNLEVSMRWGGGFVYSCHDIDSNKTNKAIELATFLHTPIDIVIASIPQHIEPFKRLCELHPNKPKLIFQIGNAWSVEAGTVKNVMASAVVENVPTDINFISYHQEFDLEYFNLGILPTRNTVTSFVNCFSLDGMFAQDWDLFRAVEDQLRSWSFKCYGGQCRDGAMHGAKNVAQTMSESQFIWHTKRGGDGFGHVLFNSAAAGRPLITKKSYYIGKLGEKLMHDSVTCIDIDNLSPSDIVDKILYYSEPIRYKTMCSNVQENFKKHVDFDREEQELRAFLSRLQ